MYAGCFQQRNSQFGRCTAILADKTKAGEWANRVDERQLARAWENSKPKSKPDNIAIPAVNAEITRLAALSIVEYEHEREAAAENLKVRVGTLDKLVTKKQAPPPQLGTGGLQDDLALKFSATYATNVRYVAAWSKWFHWDNVRWVEEKTLHAFHLARDICRKANQQAADHTMVAGVIGLARTDRRQAATAEQWDANPWLLGTPDGTIDLHTSKLSPPKPTDYITKITAAAVVNSLCDQEEPRPGTAGGARASKLPSWRRSALSSIRRAASVGIADVGFWGRSGNLALDQSTTGSDPGAVTVRSDVPAAPICKAIR
jgi:hypothetical protein